MVILLLLNFCSGIQFHTAFWKAFVWWSDLLADYVLNVGQI